MLGLAPGLFVSAFGFETEGRYLLIALAAASLVSGIVTLHFARLQTGDRSTYLKAVIEEMEAISGLNQPDSASERRTYRAIAYLRSYVHSALVKQHHADERFSRWKTDSDTSRISLSGITKNGTAFSTAVQVNPDWPQGSSWEYANTLAGELMAQVPPDPLPEA